MLDEPINTLMQNKTAIIAVWLLLLFVIERILPRERPPAAPAPRSSVDFARRSL